MMKLSQRLMQAAFMVVISCSALGADKRPNIVVILADDLGYNDVGFTNGQTEIKTPRLDALANEGVVFENGYVTHPYCGPSRAGLITGRYQARFGMENNVTYSPDDKYMGLPLTEKTFPARLQEVGYKTAIFGKWHLGGAPHFQPNERGFDYFYGFLDGGHNYMPGEVHLGAGGYLLPIMRNKGVAEFDEYLTTALSRDAARYIERTSKEQAPFFIYMSYNAPHAPLQAPQNYLEKYAHIKDEKRRTYAAMVDAMDEGIGMLIDALDKSGELDNTLIFFLSDNGGLYPYSWWPDYTWADNSPFRFGKVALTEGGVHVPFIAHWPKKITKGKRLNGLVSALDIAATSLALAGANTKDAKLDGVDLTAYVTGKSKQSPHKALFWRMEEADNLWAVRTQTEKYLNQPLPDLGLAFFDMVKDPIEQHNIAGQRPKQEQQLAKLWNDWNKKNQRNVLLQNEAYEKRRDSFYEALYQENLQDAQKPQWYIK
ncbi:sulfatase [Cellvibrio sp. BR]|uniref:sulfatase family protein n=1 Tax=Cellvibrio sp. BR TaxID=1134474 RepID=UPI0002601650|nr:sulfatase-like hydrolase/transferase [Cellvibrio sp. BR]EIK45876.1 sulfatase [Cellvibrio sp. BR]